MSAHGARRLAVALWVLTLALQLPGTILVAGLDGSAVDILFAAVFCAVQLGTSSAGALLAVRLPENAVGWLFLAMGLGISLALAATGYAELGPSTGFGRLPGEEYAAWVSTWLFVPAAMGLPVFLLLVFPDGRLPSPRWRPVAWGLVVLVVLAAVAPAFKPDRIGPEQNPVDNPLAAPGAAGEFFVQLDLVTNWLAPLAFGCGVAAIVVRFRRSRGVERLQLRWFAFAAALVALGFAGSIVAPGGVAADLAFLLGLLALAALPGVVALAVLRHRLYDLDVVINRALVYGALTAVLAGAYLGSVLLLQLALSPVTENSSLAVAGSTLAVAALFRPARARVQGVVDRRFYRRKYDAARTVEAFGARLRRDVDLDALGEELRAVLADTVQPARVSLWLRAAERRP